MSEPTSGRRIQTIKGRAVRIMDRQAGSFAGLYGGPGIYAADPGDAIYGSTGVAITHGWVRATIAGNWQAGRQHYHESVFGDACIIDVEDDVLRWATVEVDFVDVDTLVAELLLDGRVVSDGDGDPVGVTFSQGRNERAVSFEVWAPTAGECGGWGYAQVPNLRRLRLASPVVFGRGGLASLSVAGVALPSPWVPGSPLAEQASDPSGLWGVSLVDDPPPVPVSM